MIENYLQSREFLLLLIQIFPTVSSTANIIWTFSITHQYMAFEIYLQSKSDHVCTIYIYSPRNLTFRASALRGSDFILDRIWKNVILFIYFVHVPLHHQFQTFAFSSRGGPQAPAGPTLWGPPRLVAKNLIHLFEICMLAKKNPCFLSFFKLTKNQFMFLDFF